MRRAVFVIRALVVFAVLAAAGWSTEQWARMGQTGRVGGSTRQGAPFTYRVHRIDSSEDGQSSTRFDGAALAANLGMLGIMALASAAHWGHRGRSTAPGMPMRLPLGAEPLPPEANVRNEPRLRHLALRGRVALVVTVVGAILGLGLVLGIVGWSYGGRLCTRDSMLGRAPRWSAVAVREIGPPVAVTSLLALLGVLLGWGIR